MASTVRPLREITGETLFNEVFFDDVFVPDDDVVGEVNDGWAVARATLGNERVSIGRNRGGLDLLSPPHDLLPLAASYAPDDDGVRREVGALLAEEHAMASLNLRSVTRAVAGADAGAEGNVTKLLSGEHAQRVADLAMRLAGPAAAAGAEPQREPQLPVQPLPHDRRRHLRDRPQRDRRAAPAHAPRPTAEVAAPTSRRRPTSSGGPARSMRARQGCRLS